MIFEFCAAKYLKKWGLGLFRAKKCDRSELGSAQPSCSLSVCYIHFLYKLSIKRGYCWEKGFIRIAYYENGKKRGIIYENLIKYEKAKKR